MQIDVLVRTMGRSTLGRAVASALAQQGVSVRVLIQPAQGLPLDGAVLGVSGTDPRCEVLPQAGALPRAQAANQLLRATQADAFLFLDDDDWLEPGHLAALQTALLQHPEAVAVHTGARIEQAGGAEGGQYLAPDPVDADALLLTNRLAIHSVLVRRQAVEDPALRFDEGLACFEDWDFWCQLVERGPLVAVAQTTAVYCLSDTAGSGHSAPSDQRQRWLEAFGTRQVKRLTPERLARWIQMHAQTAHEMERLQDELSIGATESKNLKLELRTLKAETKALREALDDQLRYADAVRAEQRVLARALDEARDSEQQLVEARETLLNELGAFEATRQELTKLEAVRLHLLSDLSLLQAQLQGVLSSTSWRLTAPLRAAVTRWRAVQGALLNRARALVRFCRSAGLLTRQHVRHHGVGGVLRRMPHYLRRLPQRWRWMAQDQVPLQGNPFDQVERVRRQGPKRPAPPDLIRDWTDVDASVSVVIPVLNGGAELKALVRKLLAQQGLRSVEVVIVDSGSRDGSPEALRALGAKVVEILPSEFSHSHSRNVGAAQAHGDFLLFMVQDAFPIGDRWLAGLVRSLERLAPQGVVAVSCAETPRSDSDIIYDSMIHTHYRFLGCDVQDRVGQFCGEDHMNLRSQGQLSDVACLIPRALFQSYGYRGDYAEDLDLGMRLIRDGHRIAMLSSLRVIHSHNRPAYYYLKRSLVDVVFLVDLFSDFHHPRIRSIRAQTGQVAQASVWLSDLRTSLADVFEGTPTAGWLGTWVSRLREFPAPSSAAGATGDGRLDAFVGRLLIDHPAESGGDREQEPFGRALAARVEHFDAYLCGVHTHFNPALKAEVDAAVVKIFAQALGTLMAYCWLDRRGRAESDAERQWAAAVLAELKAGV